VNVTLINFILVLVLKSKAVGIPGVSVSGVRSVKHRLPVGEVPDSCGMVSLLLV